MSKYGYYVLSLNLNLKQTLKLFLKVALIISPNLCVCINNLLTPR